MPAWTPVRVGVASALTLVLVVLLYRVAATFVDAYPSSYAWSELLISYEGGPVRRGLLGEIAFLLHPFVPAHRFLTLLFVGVYLVVFGAIIWLACGRFRASSLILLASPAALLFPFGDPQAFGRKEGLFFAAFLLSVMVLSRLRSPSLALAIMMAIYAPLIMTHEVAGLSFALAVIFLIHSGAHDRTRRWVVGAAAAVMIYVAVMIGLIVALRGNPDQIARMIAAWSAIVPGAFDPPFAGGHLADTLADPFRYTAIHIFAPVTLAGYAAAFVLTVIPLAWWFGERRLRPHPVLGYWGWIAALVPLAAVFLYAGDWGRCLHFLVLQVGIMQLAAGERIAPSRVAPTREDDVRRLLVLAVPLGYFAVSWTVLHWVPNGQSALIPGPLFRALGGT